MKTLSVKQPWAHLVVTGVKNVENRTWYSQVRGPILIHAGKTVDKGGLRWCEDHGIELPAYLPTGGIVGRVNLVGMVAYAADGILECTPDPEINPATIEDEVRKWLGPESVGFVLRDPQPLPFKPCLGRLGFFEFNY
jgi:hypothetical protein